MIEKDEDKFDHAIANMSDKEKMKRMYHMKQESALVFQDYFMDLNHDLANLFLNNPFIDTALIEKKDKAIKYWNFFTNK